jgi:ribosomal protein L11 methyltransferase
MNFALWRLVIDLPDASAVDRVAAAVGGECEAVSVFEQGNSWCVEGLSRDKPNSALIEASLALVLPNAPPRLVLERVPPRDWVSENQAGFPPLRAGRFFIHGSHYRGAVPRDAIPILIDAATAFGTGEHATTRGCLLALDGVAKRHRAEFTSPLMGEVAGGRGPRADGGDAYTGGEITPTRRDAARHDTLPHRGGGMNILDMGCGTGILSIAAAKRWHRAVLACDIDPEAVRVMRINAGRNHVARLIRAETSPGYRLREIARRAPFDLVFANILARPLIEMAPDLARVLAPGGRAILSGLLARHEAAVLAAHRQQGLYLRARIALEGWRTLVVAGR